MKEKPVWDRDNAQTLRQWEANGAAWNGPVRQKPGGTKRITASAGKARPEKKLPWIEVTSILLCYDSFIWKQVLLPWHPREQFGWYLSNFLHCLGHAVFYSIVFFQLILQKSVLHQEWHWHRGWYCPGAPKPHCFRNAGIQDSACSLTFAVSWHGKCHIRKYNVR